MVVRLTNVADPKHEILGQQPCNAVSQFETVCPLPPASAFTAWGEFIVGLEEQGTSLLLNDDHSILILLIVPVPEIELVTPGEVVLPSESEIGDGKRLLWQLKVDFDWGTIAGTPELEQFR